MPKLTSFMQMFVADWFKLAVYEWGVFERQYYYALFSYLDARDDFRCQCC